MGKILERRELDEIPFDKRFDNELCHATGYEVRLAWDTDNWWNEYVDRDGNLHYGR